jgi:hypothetical protein
VDEDENTGGGGEQYKLPVSLLALAWPQVQGWKKTSPVVFFCK